MPYLLDTSVFLSAAIAPEPLNRQARQLILQKAGDLHLSAASSWEISIKYALGGVRIPDAPVRWVPYVWQTLGVRPLDVTHPHAFGAADLPPYHQDPFDRILIAQARLENMTLLTTDRISRGIPVGVRLCGA